jgi:hypothetical protein
MAQFVKEGFMVVALDVEYTSKQYIAQVAELTPEFKRAYCKADGKLPVTFAGFGGSAFADHGPEMRKLRAAISEALAPTVISIFQLIYPDKQRVQYMMVPDRFRLQTPEQRPGAEAPHVDAPAYNTEDLSLVAGYINLGEGALVFEMCPGSAGSIPEATGFYPIPKEDKDKYPMRRITVPPGSCLLFNPGSVHQIAKERKTDPTVGKYLFRLHVGFLGGPDLEENEVALAEQRKIWGRCDLQQAFHLPSGQEPPVFPQHYKGALKYKQGAACEVAINTHFIGGMGSVTKKRTLLPLPEMGVAFPPYTAEEKEVFGFKRARF